jgi:hypothetical protein
MLDIWRHASKHWQQALLVRSIHGQTVQTTVTNRPLLPTGAQKKLRFFQSAQKILKTSKTNMVKSLITNINLFFLL